jgi:RimJ/RimL family protein N-acetyltransferase
MKDLFQSERLTYRAIDVDKDEDFFRTLGSDSIVSRLSRTHLATPPKSSDAKEEIKFATQDCLLSVIICLKSTSHQNNTDEKKTSGSDTPIGVLHLMGKIEPSTAHHRRTELGIKLIQEYQNKGYGSEAILWGTEWAFKVAGLHRISIGCFEFNPRAIHLYTKLGFKEEGRGREAFWHDGRFWDDVSFGLLDREWDELVKKRKSS